VRAGNYPKISLIIPIKSSYNSEFSGYVRPMLMELSSYPGIELLVIDGSTVNRAHKFVGPIAYLPVSPRHNSKNGKVNALRTGADFARGEYIVIIDDDILLDGKNLYWIQRLLETSQAVKVHVYTFPLTLLSAIDAARSAISNALLLHGEASTVFAFWSNSMRRVLEVMNGDVLYDNWEFEAAAKRAGVELKRVSEFAVKRSTRLLSTICKPCHTPPFEGGGGRNCRDGDDNRCACCGGLA
jgi:glycosyltransferase involved in cell wall biosynthesis